MWIKDLNELKSVFCKALTKKAHAEKEKIPSLWPDIVSRHSLPYHNLLLAIKDLNAAADLQMNIPEEVIIAVVLRYVKFKPYLNSNVSMAKIYSKFFLKAFDCLPHHIELILNLIKESFSSTTSLKSSEENNYPLKLIRDMKMARLANETELFIRDRQNARQEFTNLSTYSFYNTERNLLLYFQSLNNIFTLENFKRNLTASAQANIAYRLNFVENLLKINVEKTT